MYISNNRMYLITVKETFSLKIKITGLYTDHHKNEDLTYFTSTDMQQTAKKHAQFKSINESSNKQTKMIVHNTSTMKKIAASLFKKMYA